MKLRLSTDYAIRLLLCLSSSSETQTAYDLGEKMKIPRSTVVKIMVMLKTKGWVSSQEGILGGYRMATKLASISFLDVFSVMDDKVELMFCPDEKLINDDIYRSTQVVYMYFQKIAEKLLASITLDKIVDKDVKGLKILYENIDLRVYDK